MSARIFQLPLRVRKVRLESRAPPTARSGAATAALRENMNMQRCLSVFAFAVIFVITSAISGCGAANPSLGLGYRPSDPRDLAWLEGCSDVVVMVSPPFVAPVQGALFPPPGSDLAKDMAAHRSRLQDIVGRAVAMRLQRILLDKEVHYRRASLTDPFGSLPSGLTPSETALCMISFEVVVMRDSPFVVQEILPILSPRPKHWPEVPPNAVTGADRGFMESQQTFIRRITSGYYAARAQRGRGATPAPAFDAREELRAWMDSCWTARPADGSIYTLDISASWTDSEKRVHPLRVALAILGGGHVEFVKTTSHAQWDIARLESAVSKWADLRAADLAVQVVEALRLCRGNGLDGGHIQTNSTKFPPSPEPVDSGVLTPEHEQPIVTIVTVSCDDVRFSKMAEAVDGIAIKIKDTDPEPDADVEVYRDGERILRLKDWPAGGRAFVEGRSGKRYELRLLDINDETETIRVDIAECE